MEARYKAQRNIYVTNHFRPADPLSWAYAISAGSSESITLFDNKKRIISYNNKLGTLDDAMEDDLVDINSLFKYLAGVYKNADLGLNLVNQAFRSRHPVFFALHHYSGWICDCRAFPVLEGPQLIGVALLACRNGTAVSPAFRVREDHRHERTAARF